MNPLFALRSLASYVEHVYSANRRSSAPCPSRRQNITCDVERAHVLKRQQKERKDIRELAQVEPRLRDPDALLSCSQNVSDVGDISGSSYPQHLSKEAVRHVSGVKVQGREVNTDYCAESIR